MIDSEIVLDNDIEFIKSYNEFDKLFDLSADKDTEFTPWILRMTLKKRC